MCEITTVLHSMPKKHGLSIEWLADTIGVNSSTLQRWLNPNDTIPFPIKKIIPFMRACNNDYTALDLIESRISRVGVEISSKNLTINIQTIAKLTKEASEAITELAKSISDNEIDIDEQRKCTKELLDLQKITSSFLIALNKLDRSEH